MADVDVEELARTLKAAIAGHDRLVAAEGKKIGDAHGRTYAKAAKEQIDEAKAETRRWHDCNTELRRQMAVLECRSAGYAALEAQIKALVREAQQRGEGVPAELLLAALTDANAAQRAEYGRQQKEKADAGRLDNT